MTFASTLGNPLWWCAVVAFSATFHLLWRLLKRFTRHQPHTARSLPCLSLTHGRAPTARELLCASVTLLAWSLVVVMLVLGAGGVP